MTHTTQIAYLHFKDRTFQGKLHTAKEVDKKLQIWGESVFTTVQSGYQEAITDPSFLGQHLTFSYPHIGNYPSNERVNQSPKPNISSVICHRVHYNEFFPKNNIPVLDSLDTRELIKYITNECEDQVSVITLSPTPPAANEFHTSKLICERLEEVSQKSAEVLVSGDSPIVFMNYGTKQAIVDEFIEIGYPLVTLPYNASSDEILSYRPSLVFLSNGPGDPSNYDYQIQQIKDLLTKEIPIRGICLGHQLLCQALGAKTYKLPFGHRGGNHPVLDRISNKVEITSQNHGYVVDGESLNDSNYFISHVSLFDGSVEGVSRFDHLVKSVQHHPEACPGPEDSKHFFQEIKSYLKNKPEKIKEDKLFSAKDLISKPFRKDTGIKKVLIIGSGPIKIGQASEFDYSGTQAIKALKEEGIEVVLINSNPATIMTDKELAHRTYIEPINLDSLIKVLDKENPDAIITTMGGQTALNLSLELQTSGYLKGKNIRLLGANKETIEKTEDRDLFSRELTELGYATGDRFKAKSLNEAINIADEKIGYPLIIRKDFALGGKGSTIIHTKKELENYLNTDPTYPATLERSLIGFKEIELEVMVDKEQNGVIVCSIENIDPCGIHTGDSITVAPAQTISDRCLQKLRTMSLKIAKKMGVVAGGANVQFAINPKNEDDIIVIEMNPRVSRSSALASKATGYPIAKISAKLAIGYTLPEILNDITKNSPVSFEPTQDYVAIKIPLFPFHKFPRTQRVLNTQMRSVGEALAIGSNFNEAFFKALRSLEMGFEVPRLALLKDPSFSPTKVAIQERLCEFKELSLLTCLEAMRMGFEQKDIQQYTNIDIWFLDRIQEFYKLEQQVQKTPQLDRDLMVNLKQNGFSDKYIAVLRGQKEREVLKFRIENEIRPSFRAVDTCSGEFNAKTPYYYSTYSGYNESEPMQNNYIITGSGPNRIGQGIEFDYSCVKACQSIKQQNKYAIMINSNPETVSTDYDSSDKLYLSPLYSEDVFDIIQHEQPDGVIWCFSGQTGIKLREDIDHGFRKDIKKFNFLGSPHETLELCEDRKAFSKVIKDLDITFTKSYEIKKLEEFMNAIEKIGFPIIMRPSYVIGGESMFVIRSLDDVNSLPEYAHKLLQEGSTTFLVENYIENAFEYDVDLVRDQFGNIESCVCEHIEHAGVHSGDSGMITPPVNIDVNLTNRLIENSKKLAEILEIVGPINIQYAVKDQEIYCIEANPRGSRTIPFLSKAYHVDLSQLAVKAMLGEKIIPRSNTSINYYCVKQSTFPFDRFVFDSNTLGPIMKSTGETMGIDYNRQDAIIKSYLANFQDFTHSGKVLVSLSDESKKEITPYLKHLTDKGLKVYATPGTYGFLQAMGIECTRVEKLHKDRGNLNMKQILQDEELKIVINTPYKSGKALTDGNIIRSLAALKGAAVFTRQENIITFLESFKQYEAKSSRVYSLQELAVE